MLNQKRHNRKERVGIVASDKMDKTITVRVEKTYHHAAYTRTMKGVRKFKAHDEKDEAKIGDLVRIEETRPVSKTKRWRLVEVLKKAV